MNFSKLKDGTMESAPSSRKGSIKEIKRQKLKKNVNKALHDMAENTAMHGLPNITKHKEIHKKIFWILVLLTALGILIWQIWGLLDKYYSWPVSTSTDLTFNSELYFPAVTFCNLNPVKMAYGATLDNGSALKDILNKGALPKPPRPGGEGSTGGEYTAEREDFQTFENFYNMFLALNESDRMNAGHQIDDMLLDCSWNGFTCGPENFTQFNNWQYGNCYTFNTGLRQQIEKTRQPGPIQGLMLKLFVQQTEYVPSLTSSIGVKMVVHNQSSMPFPDSEGFMVPTGTWAQVALKTVYISREDPPHGKCANYTKDEASRLTAYMDQLEMTEYTRKGCVNTCKQLEIMRKCSCASCKYPFHGKPFKKMKDENKKPCAWANETLQACVAEQDHLANKFCSGPEQCPDRCVDLQYPVTISQSYWPTNEQLASTWTDVGILAIDTNDTILKKVMLEASKKIDSESEKLDFIQKNVMVVQVFLEDLSYLSYITAESFTLEDFLSSLGGTFGLWLGMSVVTICELIEFILDLFNLCCGKKKIEISDDDDEDELEMQHTKGKFATLPGYPPPALYHTPQSAIGLKKH